MRVRLLKDELVVPVDAEHSRVYRYDECFELPDDQAQILAGRGVVSIEPPLKKTPARKK